MGKSRVHFLEYSSGKTAYHTDHLGSSNVITDQDGNLQSRFEYLPYGKTSVDERPSNPESRTNDYRFTGKELDSTGLYYYGARYYDPELGRFITPDSFVQSPFDPQTLNRYTYCRNNPLIYIDPTGHIFGFIAAIIIGAILGGAMAAISGGDIGKGILFGAIGGALTAGISSAIFSQFSTLGGTLLGKASVYAVSAFATSATVGALQGVNGSDLWRSAAISAGVAFAATMVLGSITEAAKSQNAATSKIEAVESIAKEPNTGNVTTGLDAGGNEAGPLGKIQAGEAIAEKYALSPSGNTDNLNQQYKIVESSSVKIEKMVQAPLSDYLGGGPDLESNWVLSTQESVYRKIPTNWVFTGENVSVSVEPSKFYIFFWEWTRIEFREKLYGPPQ